MPTLVSRLPILVRSLLSLNPPTAVHCRELSSGQPPKEKRYGGMNLGTRWLLQDVNVLATADVPEPLWPHANAHFAAIATGVLKHKRACAHLIRTEF